jgi:hypothetical protein
MAPPIQPLMAMDTSHSRGSEERGLPDSFVPGEKKADGSGIDPATTKNVKLVAQLGTMTCSTPAVAGGRVFLGTMSERQGVLLCLDEATGKRLWQLSAPPREVPKTIDGRKLWFGVFPAQLGVCSSPVVDGDRVCVLTHRCDVACLDVHGMANGNDGPFQDEKRYMTPPAKEGGKPEAGGADIVWLFEMWDSGARPSGLPRLPPTGFSTRPQRGISGPSGRHLEPPVASEEDAMSHVVLLGDSIFDNAVYVPGKQAVIEQLRGRHPRPGPVLLK